MYFCLNRNMAFRCGRVLTLALLLLVGGCATSGPSQQPETDKTQGANSPSDSNGTSESKNDETHFNTDAIEHLWQTRTADASRQGASREFVLGPGDVLQ